MIAANWNLCRTNPISVNPFSVELPTQCDYMLIQTFTIAFHVLYRKTGVLQRFPFQQQKKTCLIAFRPSKPNQASDFEVDLQMCAELQLSLVHWSIRAILCSRFAAFHPVHWERRLFVLLLVRESRINRGGHKSEVKNGFPLITESIISIT